MPARDPWSARRGRHWRIRSWLDLTWNAQAILGYRLTFADYEMLASVGYCALYWDYQNGGLDRDVTMSGPMLGAAMRF